MSRIEAARRMVAASVARISLARLADRMGLVVYGGATLLAHGAGWAAIVGAAALLPAALGALVGGWVVSALGGPRLTLISGLVKPAGAALLAWLVVSGAPEPWLIACILGLMAFLDMPGRVAFEASRPPVARLARLPLLRLNGWEEAADHAVALAAVLAGGFALLALGPGPAAILVAGLTCLASLTLLTALPPLRRPATLQAWNSAAFDAATGWLWRDRPAHMMLALVGLGLGAFIAAEMLLLPGLLAEQQGQGRTFLSALGLGAVLGCAGVVLWRQALEQQPVGLLLASAALSAALGLLAILVAPHAAPAIAAGGALAGLAVAPVMPMVMTVLQSRAPRAQRPQAIGIALAVLLGGAPLAGLLIGVASLHVPASALMFAVVVLLVALAAISLAARTLAVSLAALRTPSSPSQPW